MLKIEEFLDIGKIEELRKLSGRELDSNDNFSWHIALKDDERLYGVARFYKFQDGLMMDEPCFYAYDKNHYEMLFRTLLLKAMSTSYKYAYVNKNDEKYLKYGFTPYENIMRAEIKDLKFPRLCGGCKSCD